MTPHMPFGELSDEDKGKLLLAHHEGKRIEYYHYMMCWSPMPGGCNFLPGNIYRIAPEPLVPDSIDWGHVAPEWIVMARDPNGCAHLFKGVPCERCVGDGWEREGVSHITTKHFTSYSRGTVDWKDSLVIRPGYEGS